MIIVAAPNAFKGSLGASQVCRCIRRAARLVSPEIRVLESPMADGGDGTAEILRRALCGRWKMVRVLGPLGRPVDSGFVWCARQRLAIVEMARASGLALVPAVRRNPMHTTTYGTGQLIAAALRAGAERVIVAVGGSATTDCGAGAVQALGLKCFDAVGRLVLAPLTGGMLTKIVHAEAREFLHALTQAGVNIEVACDTNIPLLGSLGSAAVYAPQKGASPAQVRVLERSLAHFSGLAPTAADRQAARLQGAGAAGGLAAGLAIFCGARLLDGARLVSQLTGLEDRIRGADLVISGEGSVDAQTAMGKAPGEVARLARKHGVPVVYLAGNVSATMRDLGRAGVAGAFPIVRGPVDTDRAMRDAESLATDAAANLLSMWFAARQQRTRSTTS